MIRHLPSKTTRNAIKNFAFLRDDTPQGLRPLKKRITRLLGVCHMLELVVLVCLAENPSKCKDESLVYTAENLTPMQCLMGAQAEIAKWSEYHPRWVAKRWTCRPAGKFANL
jgi:hypothetical protein